MKIDFSEAHFLDHSIWESYCTELPGGRRRHLHHWWVYRFKPDLKAAVRKRTLCHLGVHDYRRFWHRRPGETGDDLHKRMMESRKSNRMADGAVCSGCGHKDPRYRSS